MQLLGKLSYLLRMPRSGRILVRMSSWFSVETFPEDVAGIHVADSILAARHGMTSHLAVVA